MKTTNAVLAALALAGTLAACSGSESDLTGNNTGRVNVLLTDAPFPYSDVKSVDVYVLRIDGKLAETDSAEAADEGDNSGWTTLVSPNSTINLLTLVGGKTANLGVATLPVGTYKGFRMIIDASKSSVTLNDNSHPDVKWPSAGKNGIRIKLDQPFVVGTGTSNMLIDFDVGRSFVLRGNSIKNNGLLFKPVIRAMTQQSTGTLSGTVRADNATGALVPSATVEVLKAGTSLSDTNSENVIASTVTDTNGAFTFGFLPPGNYVVRVTPSVASGYKPALLTGGATITAGNTLGGQVIIVTK